MTWFKQIRVRGYGCFKEEREWQFKPGFNHITGPNEMGKSTLMRALQDALYENPFTTARDTRAKASWGTDQGWTLELELEMDGVPVRLLKYHPADGRRGQAKMELQIRERFYDGENALQEWQSLWKIPRSVYLATACSPQRNVAVDLDERASADIQRMMEESTGSADWQRVDRMLEEEIRRLSSGRDNEIDRAERDYQSAQEEVERESAQWGDRTRHEQQAQELKARFADVEKERSALSASWDQWNALSHKQARLQELESRERELRERLNSLERLEARIEELESQMRAFAELESLPEDILEQCAVEKAKIEQATQRESALMEELKIKETHRERKVGARRAVGGLSFIGLLLLGCSAFLYSSMPELAIGAGVLGILTLIGAGWLLRTPTALPSSDAESMLKSARDEREAAENQLRRWLRQAGLDGEALFVEFDILRQRWEQRQGLHKRYQSALSERQGLLAGTDKGAWKSELRALAGDRAALQHSLETPIARALLSEPADKWIAAEQQLKALNEQAQALRDEQLRLEGRLMIAPDHSLDAYHLQAEQAALRLNRLRRKAELLKLTRALLKEANDHYRSHLREHLLPRVEHYLPLLSGGRYQEAMMDGSAMMALHPGSEQWEPLKADNRAWSAGTLDQLYFAIRLGLCDTLFPQKTPLLLDDPFVHYDHDRLQNALELLQRVSEQCQVILFSCR